MWGDHPEVKHLICLPIAKNPSFLRLRKKWDRIYTEHQIPGAEPLIAELSGKEWGG